MRLSDVLSRATDNQIAQVENFLGTRRIGRGHCQTIEVGRVVRNFSCRPCGDFRTFMSGDRLSCLIADETLVSIDVTLKCAACPASVEVWYLVALEGNPYASSLDVWLKKSVENRRDLAGSAAAGDGGVADLFERARLAYENGLGAGAMVYLRKIFEAVTREVATTGAVSLTKSGGKRKTFRELLTEVDDKFHIVPEKFAAGGYKLFSELSEVIHGGSSEELALMKFEPCRQLVLSVINKVRDDEAIGQAVDALGWGVDEHATIAGGEATA